MNRRIVPALLLLLLFSAGGMFSAAPAQEAGSDTLQSVGYLSVESLPPGLPVLLDGKSIGRTPLHGFAVQPGRHLVVVQRSPRRSWYLPDWQKEVEIAAGDTLRLRARLPFAYLIQSEPFGAKVYRNGEFLGTTPFVFETTDTALVELMLEKEGYEPAFAFCQPGGERRIHLVLTPQAGFQSNRDLRRDSRQSLESKHRRMAWIAAGLTLASGAAAILFKKRADHAYGRYQQTAHPERMNRYFNEARKFDRLSGVAFGVFQISFGVGFYLFLKSNPSQR